MGRLKTDPVVFEKQKPAQSPEARENQMIELAERRAEEQLRDGTASSQVICHYLQLATTKKRLENEKLKEEVELLKAKTETLQSAKATEELYRRAISAIGVYQGRGTDENLLGTD